MVDSKSIVRNLLFALASIVILLLAHVFVYVIPAKNDYSNYLAKEGELALQKSTSAIFGFEKIYYLAFFIVFFFFIFYFIDKYKHQELPSKSIFWKLPLISASVGIIFLLSMGAFGLFYYPVILYTAIMGLILSFVAYYKSNSYLPYIFSILGAFIVVEFRNEFLENVFCYSFWLSFKGLCHWASYGPSGVEGPIFTFGTLVYFVLFGTIISILIKKMRNN